METVLPSPFFHWHSVTKLCPLSITSKSMNYITRRLGYNKQHYSNLRYSTALEFAPCIYGHDLAEMYAYKGLWGSLTGISSTYQRNISCCDFTPTHTVIIKCLSDRTGQFKPSFLGYLFCYLQLFFKAPTLNRGFGAKVNAGINCYGEALSVEFPTEIDAKCEAQTLTP